MDTEFSYRIKLYNYTILRRYVLSAFDPKMGIIFHSSNRKLIQANGVYWACLPSVTLEEK